MAASTWLTEMYFVLSLASVSFVFLRYMKQQMEITMTRMRTTIIMMITLVFKPRTFWKN